MAGTSEGAKLGWRTRRGYQRFGGSAMHTRKQELVTVEESARLRKMRGQGQRQAAPAPAQAGRRDAKVVWRPQNAQFAGVDPSAAPDPFQVRALYGDEQFDKALNGYSVAMLRRTANELGLSRVGGDRATLTGAIMAYVRREPIERTRQRFEQAHSMDVHRFRRDTSASRPPLNQRYDLSSIAPRPAPAAPARQDKRAETLRREIAEHEAVVRAFNERHPGGAIDARDREQRLELQRVSRHYADAIHKRELLEGRPAPAAPAKSSKPVKGQRVTMEKPPKRDEGYERWKAEYESVPQRFPLGGSRSGILEMNRLGQQNPRYMRRYLKEHPVIDKRGHFL